MEVDVCLIIVLALEEDMGFVEALIQVTLHDTLLRRKEKEELLVLDCFDQVLLFLYENPEEKLVH